MAKTKDELALLKQSYEKLTAELRELSPEELTEVCGGQIWDIAVKLKEGFTPIASSNTEKN